MEKPTLKISLKLSLEYIRNGHDIINIKKFQNVKK